MYICMNTFVMFMAGMRPMNSSPVVTRLLQAHGIVLGKTNMEELAEGLTTINPVYGPVLNPYNNLYDVGGKLCCCARHSACMADGACKTWGCEGSGTPGRGAGCSGTGPGGGRRVSVAYGPGMLLVLAIVMHVTMMVMLTKDAVCSHAVMLLLEAFLMQSQAL